MFNRVLRELKVLPPEFTLSTSGKASGLAPDLKTTVIRFNVTDLGQYSFYILSNLYVTFML